MSTPITTTLYIQRLVHLVNSDPAQSDATLKKIDELSDAYARDKFAALPQPQREKKLRDIDHSVEKKVHVALQHSAREMVKKGLAEPRLQAIRDRRQEDARHAATVRAQAAQKALADRAQRDAAQREAAELRRMSSARPATPRMNTQDSGYVAQQARANEARERALNEREKQLDARETELQEQQQLLDAQVASLSQWEADLNAQRNALAAVNNSGPVDSCPGSRDGSDCAFQ